MRFWKTFSSGVGTTSLTGVGHRNWVFEELSSGIGDIRFLALIRTSPVGAGTSSFFGRSKDFVLGAFETGEVDMLCGVPTEDHIPELHFAC